MAQARRRSIGKVDMLPDEHRTAVQDMLLSNRVSYRKICEYLAENGHHMSQMAISTYARKYLKQMEMISIAQENLHMLAEVIDRYPKLDATEALLRLSSQQALNTLSNMPEEKWGEMSANELLTRISSLSRTAVYKSKVDTQNQTEYEQALEAVKGMMFTTMAKENPDLYAKVTAFLNEQRDRAKDGDEQ